MGWAITFYIIAKQPKKTHTENRNTKKMEKQQTQTKKEHVKCIKNMKI